MAGKRGLREIKELKKSPLMKILLERSLFDEKTLQILLLYYSEKATSFEEIGKRVGMGRSGVWKRWRRGRRDLERAFCTLRLALYLGLLDDEAAGFLLEDFKDYLELRRGERTVEEVKERLERRMLLALRGMAKVYNGEEKFLSKNNGGRKHGGETQKERR